MSLLWSSLVVFFLAMQGSFADPCDMTDCRNLEMKEELERVTWMPTTEEQLDKICPMLQNALRCVANHLEECHGRELAVIATSDNKTVAAMGFITLSMSTLVGDVCNKESEFRQKYLSNIACFKNLALVSDSKGKCSRDGFTAYQTYQNSVGLFEDENDEVHDSRAWCMSTAYTMACFSADLGQSCGEAARTTFVDTLKRFKYLRMTDCTEANIQELKTNFLDSLKLEEDRRNIFYTMFDQRRRK
ncbi:uncharacterized protein CDAR_621751 [Caerostris darwini]|uniref:DUF19 domain-containing protein n=1 Tax=Caerostris darwini TaxID=1538125 RepID=A0AAV4P5K3_9ARAC|nr:uncharacterized protein CDAR_621751 [Caerostris darwini]